MAIKVISLKYMINERNWNNKPIKNTEKQVQKIFDKNKNYSYIDLVYKFSKILNVKFATLIVKNNE